MDYRTLVGGAIFIVFILLLDIYTWQAIKTVIEGPNYLRLAKRIHFGTSAVILIVLLLFMFVPQMSQFKIFKTYFFAISVCIYLSKFILVFFLLFDDIIRLFRWIFQKIFYSASINDVEGGADIGRIRFLSQIGLLFSGLILAVLGRGMINGAYDYRLRKVSLKLKNLPEAFRGLKILQLSDIHSGSWQYEHKVEKGIELIKQQNADVIFFTGDLVNNIASEVEPWMGHLAEIQAPMGVYSVLGNHDYGDYVNWNSVEEKANNLNNLKQAHKKLGWNLMMNEHAYLEKGDAKIGLIGIENWGRGSRWPKYGRMKQAMEGMDNVPVKILLSHDPSHWNAEVTSLFKDIDLTLAGHTHGMQFGVEWGKLRWSPSQWAYKQWADLYQEGDQYLYVNRGFGFLGYPGRVGILPEVTVIELV